MYLVLASSVKNYADAIGKPTSNSIPLSIKIDPCSARGECFPRKYSSMRAAEIEGSLKESDEIKKIPSPRLIRNAIPWRQTVLYTTRFLWSELYSIKYLLQT